MNLTKFCLLVLGKLILGVISILFVYADINTRSSDSFDSSLAILNKLNHPQADIFDLSIFSLFSKSKHALFDEAISTLEKILSDERSSAELRAACCEVLGDVNFFGNFTNTPNFAIAKEYYYKLLDHTNNTIRASRAHFHLALIIGEDLDGSPEINASDSTSLSFFHLLAASSLMYPPANAALGFKYLHGVGVQPNKNLATNFYLLAANFTVYEHEFEIVPSFSKNSPIRLDLLDDKSQSVQMSNKETIQFYELSSSGNIEFQLALGQNYFHGLIGTGPDYHVARYYFEMAAEQNENALALSYLGLMALRGLGYTVPDYELAYSYFDRAIEEEDHSLAWFGLGLLYFEGHAVDYDEKEAIACWTKAADRGLSEAQYKLGSYLLQNCILVLLIVLDPFGYKHSKGIAYLQAAISSGNQKALFEFSEYLSRNNIVISSGDYMQYVSTCAERALAQMHIDAYNAYTEGATSVAIVSYMLCSMMGFEVGHLNSAYLLKNAPNSSRWYLSYLKRAHEYAKNADALILLGDHYFDAAQQSQDNSLYEIAVEFYLKADKTKNARAAFNLAYCYEHGFGVPISFPQAYKYYNMVILYDELSFIPIWLALVKLQFKSFFFLKRENTPLSPPVDPDKESKFPFSRISFSSLKLLRLPSKRLMYSHIKRLWSYIQKIIISILLIIASIVYIKNYFRIIREERERALVRNAQTQPVAQSPSTRPSSPSSSKSVAYVKPSNEMLRDLAKEFHKRAKSATTETKTSPASTDLTLLKPLNSIANDNDDEGGDSGGESDEDDKKNAADSDIMTFTHDHKE